MRVKNRRSQQPAVFRRQQEKTNQHDGALAVTFGKKGEVPKLRQAQAFGHASARALADQEGGTLKCQLKPVHNSVQGQVTLS
jgi:hypothetical protein